MKVNKKLLQQHLSSDNGKVVTLKDISNVQTEINAKSDGNNLDFLVNHLRQTEGISLAPPFITILPHNYRINCGSVCSR